LAEPVDRLLNKDFPIEPILDRMQLKDLDRILEIERASFPQPYSRDIFEEELTLDIAYPMVLRLGGIIVGFIDYWVVKNEIHLINVAVDVAYRHQGWGSFLVEHLEKAAYQHEATKIFLDVRESNLAAIQLYQKFGYKKVGVRRRYYSDNGENALVMAKHL
jgi:[ribosomal protein S18]-alanine N-acetyltransferase